MTLFKRFRARTTPSVVRVCALTMDHKTTFYDPCFNLAEFATKLYTWKPFLSFSGLIVVTLTNVLLFQCS